MGRTRDRRNMVRKSLIGAIAFCTNCEWKCEDYLIAQRKASAHARSKGHVVKAELTYFVEYGKRASRQENEDG